MRFTFTPLLLLWLRATKAEVCDATNLGASIHIGDPVYDPCQIVVLDASFNTLLRETEGTSTLLLTNEENLFHEGPVLFEDDNELYFTTNRLGKVGDPTWGSTPDPLQLEQYIEIKRLDLSSMELSTVLPSPAIIPMANGMTKTANGQNILALSQGFNTTGAAIVQLDRSTLQATTILDSFYGTDFNSFNDVQITTDGIIFVSDPAYGFEQGFRAGQPQLGSNLYRYDTDRKTVTTIATSLQRPNGVALFDDRENGGGCTLFLTDSGFSELAQADRGFEGWSDSELFVMKDHEGCFEPANGPWSVQPLVPATKGSIQDGIHVHQAAQLLFFCDGSGMWVYDIPTLLPVGLVPIPCTQVALPQTLGLSTLYILAETELYSIDLNMAKLNRVGEAAEPSDLDVVEMSEDNP